MTKTTSQLKKFITESLPWATDHTLNDKLVMPKKIKLQVLDFPQFYGKTIEEVKTHMEANYAMRLPDLRVMQHVWEHLEDYPALKNNDDWQFNFFFGSMLRDGDGQWNVPDVRWTGQEFARDANWLTSQWNSRDRVVLLEIESGGLEPLASLNVESLAFAREKLHQAQTLITEAMDNLKS